MGPSGTDDTGPLPAQRPRSVVTTSLSPMVGHHAGNLPRTHLRGTGEHLLVLVLPSQPTGTLALDLLPCRPGGEAAPQPVRVRWGGPGLVSTLVRATHGHPSTIPSRQAHAGRRPRRPRTTAAHRTHAPNGDGPPQRAIPGSSAVRTAQLPSRGHRRPVRPDTWMAPDAWTPDAWTPDVHVTDWTDVRTADRGRGSGEDRCPDIPGDRRPPAGRQTSPGSQRLGALGHP